jgi:AhpD family alkylhydroperoxidase
MSARRRPPDPRTRPPHTRCKLNRSPYCIDKHTKDARATGETEQRLYALAAWHETPFFTDRERAALA